MKVSGNTILVTGGTSGIGRALAEGFHDRGNRVIVTGRRQALLDDVAAGRPGLTALQLDLGDPASLANVAARIRGDFPELNFVSPDVVSLEHTFLWFFMVLIGGAGSLIGVFFGTVVLAIAPELLGLIAAQRVLITGVIMLVVVLFAPRGLSGLAARFARSGASA